MPQPVRLVFCLALSSVFGLSCSRDSAPPSEPLQEALNALTSPPASAELTIAVPAGVVATDVAIGATRSLRLDDRSKIVERSGAPATAANVGTQLTDVGVQAQVGKLLSQAPLNVHDKAQVRGGIQAASSVVIGNQVQITGGINRSAVLLPGDTSATRTVVLSAPSNGDVFLESGQTRSIGPGTYGAVTVKSGCTLNVTTGSYVFSSLDLEPQSNLVNDTTVGPVRITVKSGLIFRGTVKTIGGGGADVVMGYLGSDIVAIEAPFLGTLIAPQGGIRLATVPSPGHRGSFYARDVEVSPDVIVTHIPVRTLIRNATVDKSHICSGDFVKVDVSAAQPDGAPNPVVVTVNGDPGASQLRQVVSAPGFDYFFVIGAFVPSQHYADSRQLSVHVDDCSVTRPQSGPILRSGPSPFHDQTVDFLVTNPIVGASYAWTFGDGVTASTDNPFASHSYAAALPRDAQFTSFTVTVVETPPGASGLTTKKTIAVWNMYAVNKAHGFVQTPPTQNSTKLTSVGSSLTASYTLQNLEDSPVNFTTRSIELQPCDPNVDPSTLRTDAIALSIPAHGSSAQAVALASADVPATVCAIGIHAAGSVQQSGLKAFSDTYWDVRPNPLVSRPVIDPQTLALLNQATAAGLTGSPDHVGGEELYRLAAQRKVSSLPAPEPAGPIFFAAQPGDSCTPSDVMPTGLTCQATQNWHVAPPRVANALKGDIVLEAGCGLIGTMLRQLSPPQKFSHEGIMTRNFYELRHTTSSETRYHGMTAGKADFSADSSVTDYRNGIRTDVIQFGWQGSDAKDTSGGEVARSISDAFEGYTLSDPEVGTPYHFSSFSSDPVRCGTDANAIGPIVVRPPPGSAPNVRARLQQAADNALAIHGHYRLFAYSQADISHPFDATGPFDSPPGSRSVWSRGTRAVVSSVFIWTALKMTPGITLEANLYDPLQRGPDVQAGAVAPPDIVKQDGLYSYSEDERLAAANYVYQSTYNQVFSQLPDYFIIGQSGAEFFSDAAKHVANQLTNCFASDGCGDITSDNWKNPGSGVTVSPDDFLFWDPPPAGVYGYNERLAYREAGFERDYKVAASAGTGTVTGHVTDVQGNPVAGARVEITSIGRDTDTKADGSFELPGIPAGTYGIDAQFNPCANVGSNPPPGCLDGTLGLLETPQPDPTVTVTADATTPIELVVARDDMFRTVTLSPDPGLLIADLDLESPASLTLTPTTTSITFKIGDDETTSQGNVPGNAQLLQCSVSPFKRHDHASLAHCVSTSTFLGVEIELFGVLNSSGVQYTIDMDCSLDADQRTVATTVTTQILANCVSPHQVTDGPSHPADSVFFDLAAGQKAAQPLQEQFIQVFGSGPLGGDFVGGYTVTNTGQF